MDEQNNMELVEELYHKYYGAILDCARKLCNNSSDIHDLIQESFLRITKRIGGLKDKTKALSWVLTTIRRTHIDLWRKHTHNGNLELVFVASASYSLNDQNKEEVYNNYYNNNSYVKTNLSFSPFYTQDPLKNNDLLHNIKYEKLNQKIDLLPAHYKQVIQLFYYDGLSLAEISKKLDITEINVKLRLFRGRNALRKILE